MATADGSTVYSRVNVSMVSLKWGDVLSTLLPGALALFAIAPFFPMLDNYVKTPPKEITVGIALLIAASLAGGLLEAFTRLTWEKFLNWKCRSPNVLPKLHAQNLDLYERGVQSSYKYVTFYANFAWAVGLLFLSRLYNGAAFVSVASAILAVGFFILLAASYVQWTYYVNYLVQVFEKGDMKNA